MQKMTRSEGGKLGAKALNSDPEKKSEAARKAAATRKAKNPNIFREMGRTGGLRVNKVKEEVNGN